MSGAEGTHRVIRDQRGGAERPEQPQLLRIIGVLGSPTGGEGRPRMPARPPHTCPQGGLPRWGASDGPVRLQGTSGDQARDQTLVPPARRRGLSQEVAQPRRGLVHGRQMRPEGAPLSPVQVRSQEGGREARVLAEVHAHGLPGPRVEGHRVRTVRGPLGRGALPRVGPHEPPARRDLGCQGAHRVLRRGPRHLWRRPPLRDQARRGSERGGAGRGPGRVRRGRRHRGGPRDVHERQRQIRRGPDLSPQMQRGDAQDRMPLPSGRGPLRTGRGAERARRDRGRRRHDGHRRVLEEGPPSQVPIRGRDWT